MKYKNTEIFKKHVFISLRPRYCYVRLIDLVTVFQNVNNI